MTPAQQLRQELQAVANEIKAKHAAAHPPAPTRKGTPDTKPRAYIGSAYSTCATCGDPWAKCCCGHRV